MVLSKYLFILRLRTIALLYCFFTITTAHGAAKPNVVVVMADDIGLGDISYYHQLHTGKSPVVATPNIDQLAKTGIRFSDAHSPASLCAPSRYSMLTGNYPFRSGRINGVWRPEDNSGIEPNATTSARIAKAAGYNTAFFGKWGLGESWSQKNHGYDQLDRGALYFGFDYAVELPDGIQNSPLAFYEQQEFMPLAADSKVTEISIKQAQFTGKGGRKLAAVMMGDSAWNPELAGPMLANKAVQFIEKQSSKTPFFIYYSTQAVHIPHTPPKTLDGIKIKGATPSVFGDMILELDTQVGMLVNALKKQGLYENTLFIFTSDNGGLPVKYSQELVDLGHASNLTLRNHKGSIYEGGHRVPFFAVWPNVIKANTESDELIVGHDVVATLAAVSGQPVARTLVKDSLNLLPILTNQPQTEKHAYVTHQSKSGPTFAVRQDNWKLIIKAQEVNKLEGLKPIALFNLSNNLNEDDSLNLVNAPEHQTKIKAMLKTYVEHRTIQAPTIIALD